MSNILKGMGRAVELRPIGSLKKAKNNVRHHGHKQIIKLADQMRANGWTNPALIDEEGNVLAGHGRLLAAERLGLDKVPVIVISGLTIAQKRAVMIADNRLHDESSFDKRMLKLELEALALEGIELETTGLDTLEIDKIMSLDALDQKAPEERVNLPRDDARVIARVGDLWHIGLHRLIVGDARDPLVYERLLSGERAQLVFTDPPYGCPIENNVSGLGKTVHANFVMGAGEVSLAEFGMTLLRPAFKNMAAHAQPGALAFVFTDWRAAPHLHDAAQGVFLEQKNLIVWAKTNAGMGTTYRSAHELLFLYKISAGKHINNFGLGEGGRHRSNVWNYEGANTFRAGRMRDLSDHSTVKPQKLVADAIIDTSRRGGLVLDPFAGSGTTLSAAHSVGRRGYGIELDPKYADVILRRVSERVGEEPLLDGKKPYSEVVAERSVLNAEHDR